MGVIRKERLLIRFTAIVTILCSDKKQIRKNETDRIEVERKFSLAKGSFGLGLIRTRLKVTCLTAIALSILALNIAQVRFFIHSIFKALALWARVIFKIKKLGVI